MTPNRPRTSLPLGRFVSAIEERIATMAAEELRQVVLAFAASVEPLDRPSFLERFGATPAPASKGMGRLLADVELLEEEAASTGEPAWDESDDWSDRYGWSSEDELREPDWAPALVELLRRCGEVFLGGDPSGSAGCYERIFKVVETAMENGWSVASEPAEAEVTNEAAARYLRAVGETGDRDDRPTRLGQAVELLGSVVMAQDLSLAAVESARVERPDDRELLLEDWVTALAPLAEDAGLIGDWAHRLLVEVVDALDSLPGLARLARAGGRHAGKTFLAWFDASRRDGDAPMTAAAGTEGLRHLPRGRDRAALAERIAEQAEREAEVESAVTARVQAWDSQPSLDRFLMVIETARRAGTEAATVASLGRSPTRPDVPVALRVVLLVAGGRLDSATTEVRAALAKPERPGLPSEGSRAAGVLTPILLTAGVEASRDDQFSRSVLAALLDGAVHQIDSGRRWSSHLLDEDHDQSTHELGLGDLLVETLERLTISSPERSSHLDAGAAMAANAVAGIVEAKERRRYAQAASLAIAHAEAVAIVAGRAAGDAAADQAQARYPRHVAYRSELHSARDRSPFLTSIRRR
ncbi:MAG: hypothetical protein ACR2MN_18420 [Acidimicrobiales bacterium]